MNTALICLILAIGLIAILVRFTKPRLMVVATTRTHVEEDRATGEKRTIRDSVSMSYDPFEHQLEVRDWKEGWIETLLVGAIIAVGVFGIYAYLASPGERSVPDLHTFQFWFAATTAVIVAGVGMKAWSQGHPQVWIYFMMAASNSLVAVTTGAKVMNTLALVVAAVVTAWAAYLVLAKKPKPNDGTLTLFH